MLIAITLRAQEIDLVSNCELDSINGRKINSLAEISPQYQGGLQEFYNDLSSKVKVTDKNALGCVKVVMTFVVDVGGQIQNFCSTGNVMISEEIIESINKWTPGLIGGIKVPVRLRLPMYIKLG